MVWRCVLGGDRIAVSRPGRDAFSGNPGDLLLNIGANSGQILEMGLISLSITLSNNSFVNAKGRYNFSRDYGQAPDIRVRGIENGEILFPPISGGNVKWYSQIIPSGAYADITLQTGGGAVNAGARPNQALVMLFRKAF